MSVDSTYTNGVNYHAQGGTLDVILGELRMGPSATLTDNGTQAGPTSSLTDSTGGTPSTTFAAITAGASYAQADMVAVQNALAQTAASLNAIIAILKGIGATT